MQTGAVAQGHATSKSQSQDMKLDVSYFKHHTFFFLKQIYLIFFFFL